MDELPLLPTEDGVYLRLEVILLRSNPVLVLTINDAKIAPLSPRQSRYPAPPDLPDQA